MKRQSNALVASFFILAIIGLSVFSGCINGDINITSEPKVVDSDGDGIQDVYDKCPFIYGPISNDGCPVEDLDAPDLDTPLPTTTVAPTTQPPTTTSPPTSPPASTLPPTTVPPAPLPSLKSSDWPMRGYDIEATGYTQSSGIVVQATLWTYPLLNYVASVPSVGYGNVYVGDMDGNFYCLDQTTGGLKWTYKARDQIISTPALYKGKVYFGSYDRYVYCLDAVTGDLVWKYRTGDAVYSSAFVYRDKAYIGSWDGKMYCFDAGTGEVIWDFDTGALILSSPSYSNGSVVFGNDNGNMYCLNYLDGSLIWATNIPYCTIYATPAIYEERIFITMSSHDVICLDEKTGNQLWTYTTKNIIHTSVAVHDGRVYATSFDSFIYCIDAYSGTLLWLHKTSDTASTPTISNGVVYLLESDGLVCLNATTGMAESKYPASGFKGLSAILANSLLYFTSGNTLYCLGYIPN